MSDADREKWNARWRERSELAAPSPFLVSLDPILPRAGTALDVAGGGGRHALWLAKRGLSTTIVDVSDEAIALANRNANEQNVTLTALRRDLEREPFPEGPWDVIVSFHYLRRELFPAFAKTLAPGGVLVFVQPTRTNLERHDKPSAGFLLEDGELKALARDLEIMSYAEGWLDEGRHEARLVARKR